MLGYLETTDDGKFLWDIKLGVDLWKYNKCYEWRNWDTECRLNGTWVDHEIDISDLPPTLFFMAVVNTYSTGFGYYTPLDEPVPMFSKEIAPDVRFLLADNNSPEHYRSRISYVTPDAIDLQYLNATGKIRSTAQWNHYMCRQQHIHIWDDKVFGSIQSIVDTCQKFTNKHK